MNSHGIPSNLSGRRFSSEESNPSYKGRTFSKLRVHVNKQGCQPCLQGWTLIFQPSDRDCLIEKKLCMPAPQRRITKISLLGMLPNNPLHQMVLHCLLWYCAKSLAIINNFYQIHLFFCHLRFWLFWLMLFSYLRLRKYLSKLYSPNLCLLKTKLINSPC